ncbi:hypothetical protein JCM3775_002532 [Rhodotorula graminis]
MTGRDQPHDAPARFEDNLDGPARPNGSAKRTSTSSSSSPQLAGSSAPLAYVLIRWLFRFVLRVFYSSVVVEGAEHIPRDGVPCMITANHSNSLTDALLLVTTVPPSRRSLLRLTAKDTQFGRGTFTSWLIESAGTLPIKRPKDHAGQPVDNGTVFETLIGALEHGDAIVLFPEGMSRYYPEIAPLKQGVSRIVSDTLSRQKDNPAFELAVQTASITYLHRNLFRSDVLVTFHPPIFVSARTHPDLIASPSLTTTTTTTSSSSSSTPGARDPSAPPPTAAPNAHERAIRSLTASIGASIRSGILDAPSWSVIRIANTARRLHAPLGTSLTLGDHVRLTQRFVDALAGKKADRTWDEAVGAAADEGGEGERGEGEGERGERRHRVEEQGRGRERERAGGDDDQAAPLGVKSRPGLAKRDTGVVWKTPMRGTAGGSGGDYFALAREQNGGNGGGNGDAALKTDDDDDERRDELVRLRRDLKTYQDLLYLHGIKDDRVRNTRLLHRRIVLKRLVVRIAGSVLLFLVSIPGLVLWVPVFLSTRKSSGRLVRKGPVFDTYDEVAQTKLVTGLISGLAVLAVASLVTFPLLPLLNVPVLLAFMWLTLRFLEDLTSSLRAALALARLLFVGKRQLLLLREMRDDLRQRVERLAVERAGLPRDADVFVQERDRRWKRVGLAALPGSSFLDRFAFDVGFFDVRRRRKKDWNEALKLWDQTEYVDDEVLPPGVEKRRDLAV